ncbi:MAG: hypothetical protein DMD87_21155 [Candidatus Rokuibacteriota bacterium]|nr:MAG: hypothetical protein DMD87_21155 [Candidatus Rokubacteria bacterium]
MPELVYHGWSCFTLTTVRGLKVVFDPNWTNPFGRPSPGPSAFSDADLCLVTHGHFDHIQDVPGLLKASRMVLAASAEVCRFLRETHGIPADRIRELDMDQSLDWNGLRVTTFEWEHRIVDTGKMFAARPEAKAMLSGLYFSNPYDARRMGFTVRLENGLRVTYYGEGFNDQTRFERVRAVGDRDRPDVVVAGAQLDYPRQVAEAAAILRPRRLLLFHPHPDFFDFIGLRSRPAGEFVSTVRESAPAIAVEAVDPGRRLAL